MTDVQRALASFAVGEFDTLPAMTHVSPPNSPTEVSVDAVSSLRAAALSSLRMKRKKAPDANLKNTISSRRDGPQNALTLDYGIDDPSTTTSTTSAKADSGQASDKKQDEAPSMSEDSREEGEISDEEDTPVAGDDTPRISHALGNTSNPEEDRSLRTRSPSPLLSRKAKAEVSLVGSAHQHQHPLIDEQHVRPGLTSTFPAYLVDLGSNN